MQFTIFPWFKRNLLCSRYFAKRKKAT